MTILDTDTVTLYAMGHEKVGARVDAVGGPAELAVAVITHMEILRGRFDSILKAADETQLKMAMQRFRICVQQVTFCAGEGCLICTAFCTETRWGCFLLLNQAEIEDVGKESVSKRGLLFLH